MAANVNVVKCVENVIFERFNTNRFRMEMMNVRLFAKMLPESWSDSSLAACTQHQGCV